MILTVGEFSSYIGTSPVSKVDARLIETALANAETELHGLISTDDFAFFISANPDLTAIADRIKYQRIRTAQAYLAASELVMMVTTLRGSGNVRQERDSDGTVNEYYTPQQRAADRANFRSMAYEWLAPHQLEAVLATAETALERG